jgi:ketosteroid isomerase-like protein
MATIDDPVAVVRRALDAYDRDDAAQLRGLFAPDHVEHLLWHEPLPLPGDASQPLLDRYEQVNANAQADFAESRTAIDEQFACGDRVVTAFTLRATHRKSGTPVAFRGITIDRVVDGKIVETWSSVDRLGLLQQLGTVAPSRQLFEEAGLTL